MQKLFPLVLAATLLAGYAHAQTRPARPVARPTYHPVAKAPVSRPAVPTTAKSAPAAKPAAVAPAPVAAQPGLPEKAVSHLPATKAPASKSATDRTFGKGANAVNLGVGFGLGYGLGYGSNVSQTPALSISYMRGVADVGPGTISAGGMVGYKGISWKDGSESGTWRNIYVGGRGAYHYSFHNPKLDAYAGLGIGLRVVSYSDSYNSGSGTVSAASGSQLEMSGFAGARYFFSDKIGAFSELGYDMSYFKVGLSARF